MVTVLDNSDVEITPIDVSHFSEIKVYGQESRRETPEDLMFFPSRTYIHLYVPLYVDIS